MRVVVLGASGRTGRRLLEELIARDHEPVVVLRDHPASLVSAPQMVAMRGDVEVHLGDARDVEVLRKALNAGDAVVSALDSASRAEGNLYRDVAVALVETMRARRVERYVGISAAGVRIDGDEVGVRSRLLSWLRHGSREESDRQREYRVWAASGLDWTLIRPARLVDRASWHGSPPRVEHDRHRAPRRTGISRDLLARFVVDELECPRHIEAAPIVGSC